jgi:hypothetical protein
MYGSRRGVKSIFDAHVCSIVTGALGPCQPEAGCSSIRLLHSDDAAVPHRGDFQEVMGGWLSREGTTCKLVGN